MMVKAAANYLKHASKEQEEAFLTFFKAISQRLSVNIGHLLISAQELVTKGATSSVKIFTTKTFCCSLGSVDYEH